MRIPAITKGVLAFFQVILFALGACSASGPNADLAKELDVVYTALEDKSHKKRLADNEVLRAEGAASKRWVGAKKATRAFYKMELAHIANDAPKGYKPLFTMTPPQMEKLSDAERQAEYERVATAAGGTLPALMKSSGKNAKAEIELWLAAEAVLAAAVGAAGKAGEAVDEAKANAITALQKFKGDLASRYPGDHEEQDSYSKPAAHDHAATAAPAPAQPPAPTGAKDAAPEAEEKAESAGAEGEAEQAKSEDPAATAAAKAQRAKVGPVAKGEAAAAAPAPTTTITITTTSGPAPGEAVTTVQTPRKS